MQLFLLRSPCFCREPWSKAHHNSRGFFPLASKGSRSSQVRRIFSSVHLSAFCPTCFPPDPVMDIKCNSRLITGIYTSTSKPSASTCTPAALGSGSGWAASRLAAGVTREQLCLFDLLAARSPCLGLEGWTEAANRGRTKETHRAARTHPPFERKECGEGESVGKKPKQAPVTTKPLNTNSPHVAVCSLWFPNCWERWVLLRPEAG